MTDPIEDDDTDTETETTVVYDTKHRLVVGALLVALLWAVVGTCTMLLVFKSPTPMSSDDVGSTVFLGVAVAAVGTGFLGRAFFF